MNGYPDPNAPDGTEWAGLFEERDDAVGQGQLIHRRLSPYFKKRHGLVEARACHTGSVTIP